MHYFIWPSKKKKQSRKKIKRLWTEFGIFRYLFSLLTLLWEAQTFRCMGLVFPPLACFQNGSNFVYLFCFYLVQVEAEKVSWSDFLSFWKIFAWVFQNPWVFQGNWVFEETEFSRKMLECFTIIELNLLIFWVFAKNTLSLSFFLMSFFSND